MFNREKITPGEAATIKSVASNLAIAVSDCGPWHVQSVDGNKTQHTNISGFDYDKARNLIEDGIWEILLKL